MINNSGAADSGAAEQENFQMAFCERTLDFLFENRVMDSKAWFEERRGEYEEIVLNPLRELVRELTPYMLEIDPLLNCEPKVGKCISRIFRDTRYTHDKHIFRDVMWVSFFRRRKLFHGTPGFFFELSPRGLCWGCGYYQAAPETLEVIRSMMLSGDKSFKAALRMLKKHPEFQVEGDRYKRSRYPDAPEELQSWLNMKNYCLLVYSDEMDLLWSEELPAKLGESFKAMKPFYDFLMTAEARTLKDNTGRHDL